ncbi:MAG: helix-turn-helix domain-containing protein [Suipraeoptans sp.]
MLVYKIDVLQELKERGYNTNYLRANKLIGESSIQKLRSGIGDSDIVGIKTLNTICELLNMDISEILTYKK